MVFILVFERLKSAVEKGVFYTIDEIGDDTFQSKGKSLLALLRKFEIESDNLSYFVGFPLSQILINKTIFNAVNRLRIHADDLLTHVPIAHLIPQHRSGYTVERIPTFRNLDISV
jgi:hypothetical protein